ncbi:ABC transporter permease, partial [Actinosynnema sp. NPDC023658]
MRASAVAGAVLGLFAVAAVWPELLTSRSPVEVDLTAVLRPPGAGHWLGTDQLGRDVWARIVHGAGRSLLVGLGAAASALVVGTALGAVAALGG